MVHGLRSLTGGYVSLAPADSLCGDARGDRECEDDTSSLWGAAFVSAVSSDFACINRLNLRNNLIRNFCYFDFSCKKTEKLSNCEAGLVPRCSYCPATPRA